MPSRSRTNRDVVTRHQGLTLVELLVAISILGIIAVLGWEGLDSIVRARIELAKDLEQARGIQLAFAQMQSDCSHLAAPASLPNRLPLAFSQNRLTLVRSVLGDDQPMRLQVIAYRVRAGLLTRRESNPTRDLRVLDTQWQAALNDSDAAPEVGLQSSISTMTMRLWVNGGNNWLPDTGLLTPSINPGSVATPPAPTGLEMTVVGSGQSRGMVKILLLGAV
jgi:general secretion pathway protein J